MLVLTIKLLEFSDKNWETYERLLIFWSIFWLFFLLSKVSKMKFYRKSLIYKNTTLYDIDFPRKIGFLRFFLRKFLLTVLLIFHREYTQIFKKSTFPYTPIYYIFIPQENFMKSYPTSWSFNYLEFINSIKTIKLNASLNKWSMS